MAKEYGWTVAEQGWVLSSFFFGYIMTQVLGGMLARKLGGKVVLNFAVLWWSFFTFITPWSADRGLTPLLVCRVLMGMGEGMAFPTIFELFSLWVPVSERARSFSAIHMGGPLGTVGSLCLSPIIVKAVGWRSVFYFFGIFGFIWNAAWTLLGGNGPTGHDKVVISVLPERDSGMPVVPLHKTLSAHLLGISYENKFKGANGDVIPWKKLLTNPSVLAILVTHFCHNWGHYLLLAWLPTYFHRQLGVAEGNLGVSCIPYIFMALGSGTWGIVADRMVAQSWNLTAVRKFMTGIGMFSGMVFVSVFGASTSAEGGIVAISTGMLLASAVSSGALINHLDVAPRLGAPLLGLTNTVATLPGMVAVPLSGAILAKTGSWKAVFGLASFVYATGGAVYLKFGSGERQFE
mmetsp:Transcript_62416/g.197777  ORF Transcript_62416/g.197777 Transcript_62416/m.197777 type:complete len:405 (+) Transcript_62416:414-1628(+)